ncbi:MAG: SDR family NAD(P)-dependent oxidoreductase, partial [Verrucomicrobiales bacterium]
MNLSRSVRGSRVILTGAASGIGLATAKLLAAEGAWVGALDRTGSGLVEAMAALPDT